jgi:hypothetical protein
MEIMNLKLLCQKKEKEMLFILQQKKINIIDGIFLKNNIRI